ncbi:hypothetical protein chiPu_0003709 [Chiloscyllium punctatum]|uniref:Uncharacterized protein n=1 Tax=Chiloscyllium punctatum TaxID=137246 RepID=A0A401S4H0_CHIPU|nr:hypothetical protein [Chiloscyllium punctatum]
MFCLPIGKRFIQQFYPSLSLNAKTGLFALHCGIHKFAACVKSPGEGYFIDQCLLHAGWNPAAEWCASVTLG